MIGASERVDDAHPSFEGSQSYLRQGWIPTAPFVGGPIVRQSVSKTLEFAYDDACLALFARALGRAGAGADAARRSANWTNVFDSSTGFMRGRNADGSWVAPFDPARVNFADYTEANAWQYSFFVPHDVPGLIRALGGDEAFASKLDAMFDTTSPVVNNTIGLTGLVGMYCHGNEPCHAYAYLYPFAGLPWKTQARVRQIASAFYTTAPDGLCGNDDCGQTSAWFVFAALGFYPVDPPSGVYVLGSPLADKAENPPGQGALWRTAVHGDCPEQFRAQPVYPTRHPQWPRAQPLLDSPRRNRRRRRSHPRDGPAAEPGLGRRARRAPGRHSRQPCRWNI